jgi:fumarate hydratase subunit alpha
MSEPMNTIEYEDIVERVDALCRRAAYELPPDVLDALEEAREKEESPVGRSILDQCLENASIARDENLPICQDTGTAVFFVEYGSDVHIDGGTINEAISDGTARGYREGYLRKSIVEDPVFSRDNTGDNTPPIVHVEAVPGSKLRIRLAMKGGGSENMSAVRMLEPSAGREGVVRHVVETVIGAGGNPCPPTIIGVGIGGDLEKSALLAKKSLLRPVGEPHPDANYADLERDILGGINDSGVGPQGLGGRITALAVHVEHFPCHIASLPVAVNLNCHAARHASTVIE